jgi:hypothetical protein
LFNEESGRLLQIPVDGLEHLLAGHLLGDADPVQLE